MTTATGTYGCGIYDSFHGFHPTPQQQIERDAHVDKHHIRKLPASLEKFREERFSLNQVQQTLHRVLSSKVARDSTRYYEFMGMLKRLGKRRAPSDDGQLQIYRADFHTLMTELGVFCTPEQAEILFDMYDDMDGVSDGTMAIQHFIQRARDPDYGEKEFFTPEWGHTVGRRTGPKLFPNTSNYGVPVEARLPSQNVYKLSVRGIVRNLRAKLEALAPVGSTHSDFRVKRKLTREFEYFDNDTSGRRGFVSAKALYRILHNLNFPVSEVHMALLLRKFRSQEHGPGTFVYHPFIDRVYPAADEPNTGLPLARDTAKELWEFMDSIDTDGDGTVSLDEMLAFTRANRQNDTPPPLSPDSDGSMGDAEKNMLARIATLTTRKAGVYTPAPPGRDALPPSRGYSRGLPPPSRAGRGYPPSRAGPPSRSGSRNSVQTMRVGTPIPPATARVSRPPTPAERRIMSRGSHTARLSRSRQFSRMSQGSRGF